MSSIKLNKRKKPDQQDQKKQKTKKGIEKERKKFITKQNEAK